MATATDAYECLHLRRADGIARITLDHPPINLLDRPLMVELDRVGRELEDDNTVNVVVVDSAHPEFFIAHADVGLILQLPREEEQRADLGIFHAMVERFRAMPKATIAVIEGIARGGGCELALSMDMRFAAADGARLGQPEVALGIIPGGSGTQRLARLIGRARAVEAILGGDDVDAATAERWGWVNRALPATELRPFVNRLAQRIASFPPVALAAAKAAIDAAFRDPVPGLLEEWRLFTQCLTDPEAIRRMERFLEIGGQTAPVERDLPAVYDQLAR